MSTRAIVGYKRSDGTVVGAWCWNDGYDIKKDLKRDFKSLLDVNFILEVGMFSTIYSKKEYEDFLNEYNNHKNSFIRIIETTIEGDLLIYDLLYYNDFLYLVTDYSRDKYATETDKELSLEKYKYLSNYKYKNKTYLVLNNEEINENNFKNGTVFTISK